MRVEDSRRRAPEETGDGSKKGFRGVSTGQVVAGVGGGQETGQWGWKVGGGGGGEGGGGRGGGGAWQVWSLGQRLPYLEEAGDQAALGVGR